MTQNRSAQQLAKFLSYVLERRPDEFGLVADDSGYFRIKDLLKAINEEQGWRHVRRSHLNEILLSLPNPPFEISDPFIRGLNREQLPAARTVETFPKLLYICVRQKAHPVALEKGLFPSGNPSVVLSSDRELALRLGKRIDSQPVLLSVHVEKCLNAGIVFRQAGQSLFLTDFIPPSCLMGPPLPRDKPQVAKPAPSAKVEPERLPGSFLLNLGREPGARSKTRNDLGTGEGTRKKKGKRKGEKWVREVPPWRR